MKPLNTISALTLANLGHAQLPPLIAVPLNIPSALGPTYRKLYQFCIDSFAANPDVYVGVQYANFDNPVAYAYDQCYPYQINGNAAQMAVFCQAVHCCDNPGQNCAGCLTIEPLVLVPAGLTLINPAGIVGLIGYGATCKKVDL